MSRCRSSTAAGSVTCGGRPGSLRSRASLRRRCHDRRGERHIPGLGLCGPFGVGRDARHARPAPMNAGHSPSTWIPAGAGAWATRRQRGPISDFHRDEVPQPFDRRPELPLWLLRHYVSSIRHQQYHDIGMLTFRVESVGCTLKGTAEPASDTPGTRHRTAPPATTPR